MISYKRLKDATTVYLQNTKDDVYVLDESCNPMVAIVTEDGHETLCFIKIYCDMNGDNAEDHWDRGEAERFAGQWLFENEKLVGDIQVRFDEVFYKIVTDGRALLRYHSNCLGFDDDL